MKDDSGNFAVFTEQGASASHMTAARVLDVISRLPWCSGQASDAVSAYTRDKIEVLHLSEEDCPKIGSDYRKQEDHNIGTKLTIWVTPQERNLDGHPLAGLYLKTNCNYSCQKMLTT